MPWPIKTCPSRMRSLPSPRHCLKNFTTDNFNQGSQVVHPFHLAARTCLPCAARPRCHVQPVVASTLCRGHSKHGVSLHFFGGCFHLPSFQSIGPWFHWPAADTALRQELGAAAACSLRFPLHAAALPPRPTCKVCFSKNFLWKTSIGCLVFETFINDLLQALTAF